jgi:hypothetical protein
MSKSADVTTRELESVVNRVNALCAERCRLDRRRRETWRAWRTDMVGRAHSVMKPAARPYAGKALAGIVQSLLADLDAAWRWADELDDACDELDRELDAVQCQEQAASQITALTHELAQARAELARRPAATSLVLPAQKITVESAVQRKVLDLMASEGLGRVWRIVGRVLDSELTGNANSIRNGIARLVERGLLADYEQHGKPIGWAYKAGGTRRLVQLTPVGRQWCQAAFGSEPVESEISVAARRHKSVSHGVAILEAAHHLAAAGYAVDDDPQALLADDTAPWHARAEPDLALLLQGEWWPAEIQREVSPRVVAKWAKSLELCGRLALVLYHEEARKKQAAILTAARFRLPAGVIRLASLEQMERGAWAWQEITTTGS